MITYRTTATLATFAAFGLFIMFAFLPFIANYIYGIDGDAESNFVLRRAAFLLLGLGIMAWLTRSEPPSRVRNALALGFGVDVLGIMVTGIYDWATGFAGNTIWLLTAVEAFFGGLFVYHSRERVEG
ncbi:hypothetical protein ACFQ14_13595 [Pseudahrensia aquimaris]|uniref:DUF4345 domain-containing protein n=1 Tax=Pseudahrensia aquimaris TaxID=744461 RepID=A0ABW3FMS7_9HYPH